MAVAPCRRASAASQFEHTAGVAGVSAAESLASLAREAARRDANVDAMLLFREAVAREPGRRDEWLRELADQTLWSGLTGEAVALYRELLARGTSPREEERRARLALALAESWNGQLESSLREYEAVLQGDPADLQARLGQALVLSWLDRNAASKNAYEQILREHPGNPEALRNLGRVQSWRGKHRDAEQRLQELFAAEPGDTDTALWLAQTQQWLGRPDRAKATLRSQLQAAPADPRTSLALRNLERSERSDSRFGQQESRQSDDLAIHVTRFAHDVVLNEGLTTVGARYEFQRYDPAGDDGSIDVHRPGGHGRHRFSDGLEWTALLFVDRIDVRQANEKHTRFTYSTWLTLWPNDLLRLDVGSDRTTLDNVRSLSQNIVATYVNLATDVLPDERTRLVGRLNWGDYTDGNARLWGQVELERRFRGHPRILGGARTTAFHFRHVRDNGYFNPRDYFAADATCRLSAGRDTFRYALDGSAGFEHASPGGSKFIWSGSARIDYLASPRFDVGALLSHFSSATASSSGFARTTVEVRLRVNW